jgi:hypothetical protein
MRDSGYSNKKGNAVMDGIVIVVILFILGLVSLVGVYIENEIYPDLHADFVEANATNATGILEDVHTRTPGSLDALFAMFLALFWICSVVLAYFIDTHPVYFAITLILLIIVFIVGGVLSNTYAEVNADFGNIGTTSLPMTTYIMDHLLGFILGIVTTIAIALFAKSQAR